MSTLEVKFVQKLFSKTASGKFSQLLVEKVTIFVQA